MLRPSTRRWSPIWSGLLPLISKSHRNGSHHLRLAHLVVALLCGSESARTHTRTARNRPGTRAHTLSHMLEEYHLLLLLR